MSAESAWVERDAAAEMAREPMATSFERVSPDQSENAGQDLRREMVGDRHAGAPSLVIALALTAR
jgi:hypothetical protein